jgi:hypothetical protein
VARPKLEKKTPGLARFPILTRLLPGIAFAQRLGIDGANLQSSITAGRSTPEVPRSYAHRTSQQA